MMPERSKLIYPLLSDFREIDTIKALIESEPDILCYEYMPEGKVSDGEYRLINILIERNYNVEFVITDRKESFYVIKSPVRV